MSRLAIGGGQRVLAVQVLIGTGKRKDRSASNRPLCEHVSPWPSIPTRGYRENMEIWEDLEGEEEEEPPQKIVYPTVRNEYSHFTNCHRVSPFAGRYSPGLAVS